MKLSKQFFIWIVVNLILAALYYLSVATDQGWYAIANVYLCIEFVFKIFFFALFGGCALFADNIIRWQKQANQLDQQKSLMSRNRLIPLYLVVPVEIIWIIALFNYDFVFGAVMTTINLLLLGMNLHFYKEYKKKVLNSK